MKVFAHGDTGQKALADLNQAVVTALKVTRNEYKYVADLELDLRRASLA